MRQIRDVGTRGVRQDVCRGVEVTHADRHIKGVQGWWGRWGQGGQGGQVAAGAGRAPFQEQV